MMHFTLRTTSLPFIAFLGLIGGAPVFGQELRGAFEPVYISTEDNARGNGARFRSVQGCTTITAGHVVADSIDPNIVPFRASDRADTNIIRNRDLDIALIQREYTDAADCPSVPSVATMEKAIRGGVLREVWITNSSGYGAPLRVRLLDVTDTEMLLELDESDPSRSRFQPGMSGAVVVFDGIPVAILTEASTGNKARASAALLSRIVESRPEILQDLPIAGSGATSAEQTTSVDAAFSIFNLPTELNQQVISVRQMYQRARLRVEAAITIRNASIREALIAEALPENEFNQTHYRGRIFNGDYYAGEINPNDNEGFFIDGYGVWTRQDGVVDYCLRADGPSNLCLGPTYREVPDTAENTSQAEFMIYEASPDGRLVGEAYIKYREGQVAGLEELWINVDGRETLDLPGNEVMIIFTDGKRYEGTMPKGDGKGDWADDANGFSVIWDANGTLVEAVNVKEGDGDVLFQRPDPNAPPPQTWRYTLPLNR